MTIQAVMLPDGRRLHLQHGPIDLIVEAFGARGEVERAYAQAVDAFGDVLPRLVAELPALRAPLGPMPPAVDGPVARRMVAACWPHREGFITPMAAVAGSVADYVLRSMVRDVVVRRAYVNDGGDIAICLAPGETLTCGVATDVQRASHAPILRDAAPSSRADDLVLRDARHSGALLRMRSSDEGRAAPQDEAVKKESPHPEEPFGASAPNGVSKDGRWLVDGTIKLTADMPVRGVATSGRACKGRGGRSFSFGIADAVTVLAADAAAADAAATVIANAVDLPGQAAVTRVPALDIDPDSDLGERLVTLDVGPLGRADIEHALRAGVAKAESLRQAGHIYGAVLVLQQRFATVGPSLARLAA